MFASVSLSELSSDHILNIWVGDKNLLKPNSRRGNFVQYKLDVVGNFGAEFLLRHKAPRFQKGAWPYAAFRRSGENMETKLRPVGDMGVVWWDSKLLLKSQPWGGLWMRRYRRRSYWWRPRSWKGWDGGEIGEEAGEGYWWRPRGEKEGAGVGDDDQGVRRGRRET